MEDGEAIPSMHVKLARPDSYRPLATAIRFPHNAVAMSRWSWLVIVSLWAMPAFAHPIGYSGMRFLVYKDKATAILTIHTRDMTDWFPPLKYPDYVTDVCKAIIADPSDLLDIQLDGKVVAANEKRSSSPEVGMIEVDLTYPIAKMPATIAIWSKLLVRLPAGHQQLLYVEDMRSNPGGLSGPDLFEGTLSREEDGTTVDIPVQPLVAHGPTSVPFATATTQTTQPVAQVSVAQNPVAKPTSDEWRSRRWLILASLGALLVYVIFVLRGKRLARRPLNG